VGASDAMWIEEPDPDFRGVYEAWFRAVAGRDLVWFERVLAPEWLYVDVTGRVRTKEEYIRYVAELPEGVALLDPELSVRVIGEIALVQGRYRVERTLAGLPPTSVYRVTAVWQRAGEGWQALAHHATAIDSESDRN
jgi:ketosteroid isomerase-like protein